MGGSRKVLRNKQKRTCEWLSRRDLRGSASFKTVEFSILYFRAPVRDANTLWDLISLVTFVVPKDLC